MKRKYWRIIFEELVNFAMMFGVALLSVALFFDVSRDVTPKNIDLIVFCALLFLLIIILAKLLYRFK